MSDAERAQLMADFRKIVREELEDRGGCLCNLSAENSREMTHFFGLLKDLGHGDASHGIEVLREQAGFTRRFASLSGKLATVAIVAMVTSLVGAVLALLWLGLAAKLGGGRP